MKKKFTKILTLALAGILTCATFTGCATEEAHPELPDYASNGKQFLFFTYGGLNTGKYTITDQLGNETTVEYGDMRTVEKYKEYKDCGF